MTPQQPIANEIASRDLRAAVVQPDADLVSAHVAVFRSRLRDVVSSGVLHLTVDLAGVRLVDSSGIGLLVAAHNSLKKSGGELAVIHASQDILDLLRTMRIHQHFSVSGN
jgi:anti-anti-sigma factor